MSDTDSERSEEGGTEPLTERIDYRRVASAATTVLVIAAAVPFVVYAFPGLVGAQSSFVVLSGSMEPAMSPGDVIVIEDVEASEIEKGDVITYGTDAERPTTHRVTEVRQENGQPVFKTEGDANEAPDSGVVTPDEVRGRVPTVGGTLFVIPYVGHVILFAGTQLGFTLLFVTPVVLFVGSEVFSLVRSAAASGDTGTDADAEASERGATEAADADAGEDDTDETDDGVDRDLPEGVEPAIVPLDETSDDGTERTAEDAESEDAAITLTAAELSLGLAVLGAFFAYSVWVSYATVEVWAMTVTGASGTAFAMLSGLYVFGGGEPDADAEGEDVESEATGDDVDADAEEDEAESDEAAEENGSLPVSELPPTEDLFGDATLDDPSGGPVWPREDTPFEADEWPDADDWADAEFESRDEIVFGGDGSGLEGMNDD